MAVSRDVSNSTEWIIEPSGASEEDPRFREVPVPALPPDIGVPRQGVERVLGHRLARAILAKRLDQTVGGVVRSTLDGYAAVLRRWALNRLEEIRAAWTATTDALRADIDRRLGHAPPTSVSGDAISQDLARLASLAVR